LAFPNGPLRLSSIFNFDFISLEERRRRTVGEAWRFRVSAFWRRARLLVSLERTRNASSKAQPVGLRW
jgi:hypothetical protein